MAVTRQSATARESRFAYINTSTDPDALTFVRLDEVSKVSLVIGADEVEVTSDSDGIKTTIRGGAEEHTVELDYVYRLNDDVFKSLLTLLNNRTAIQFFAFTQIALADVDGTDIRKDGWCYAMQPQGGTPIPAEGARMLTMTLKPTKYAGFPCLVSSL